MIIKLATLPDLSLERPTMMGLQEQFTVGVPKRGIPNSAKTQAKAQLNVLNNDEGPQFTPMATLPMV